jgi:hypothetical protein
MIDSNFKNETVPTTSAMIQILHSQKISYEVIQEMSSIMAATESVAGNDFEIVIEMYDCNKNCKMIRLIGSTDLTRNQFVKIMDQTAERIISIQNEWKVGGKMK